MDIILFLSFVCSKCALTSFAIVLSLAVALLVVVTKSSFCIHYVYLLSGCLAAYRSPRAPWTHLGSCPGSWVCTLRDPLQILPLGHPSSRMHRGQLERTRPWGMSSFSRADPIPVATREAKAVSPDSLLTFVFSGYRMARQSPARKLSVYCISSRIRGMLVPVSSMNYCYTIIFFFSNCKKWWCRLEF